MEINDANKDRMEQFIRDHRDEFDIHEPDPDVWNRILLESQKTVPFRISLLKTSMRVAAVVVLVVVSWMANDFIRYRKNNRIPAEEKASASEFVSEFKEAEAYYNHKVSQKLNELELHIGSNPELVNDIKNDLAELDSMYVGLRKDLNDQVDNREIVEAMIQNYRFKLEILEDILLEMNEKNKQKKNENENNAYQL